MMIVVPITQRVFRRQYELVDALELCHSCRWRLDTRCVVVVTVVSLFKNASTINVRCSFQQRSIMIYCF
jgi:hypothetical protein